MNRLSTLILASAIFALGMPLAACAQSDGGQDGPPPQVQKARDDARAAAFKDLSADHRAKVQSIVDQVKSGSLSPEDGARQIDNVLTPNESKAVLAEGQKMRDAMRAAFQNGGGDQGGPPQGGGWHGGGGGGMGGGGWQGHRGSHKPDAGRTLLMLAGGGPRPPQ